MKLQLKRSASPGALIAKLRNFANDANTVRNISTGVQGSLVVRDQYLQLIERIESAFAAHVQQTDLVRLLHTDRYWHIREITSETSRPYPLINSEIDSRIRVFNEIADALEARVGLWSGSEGSHTAVLCTNVLLRIQPPWQIRWSQFLGHQHVRLIVPLRVIEELDKLKYSGDTKVRQVVRRLLPQLESKLLDANGGIVRIDPTVTLEVPVEPGPRDRPNHADEEILTTCESILQFANQRPMSLVTEDTGMRLQAQARGIPTVRVPDEFKRSPEDDEVSP